ncbi:MAG TPA: tetratricopeptide repeat protein [Ignavibacteriaceae bacterium]|nr:tetratricopeptide repeat protein [Ignavibacteriaceae bacterium]
MKVNILLLGFILFAASLYSQTRDDELRSQASQLMSLKRYGEAIDLLNRFIASNPQNVEGFLLRGTCYEKRGDFEFAVYDYRTAKKISPSNAEVDRKLKFATESWTKLLLNKIEGHKREIAIHPSRAINYLAVGIAYKNLGEWKEAEIWYDEYLKREEASADEVLRYSEILAKNNQLKKGETKLKDYSIRNADDHRIWSRYGYFLYWLGKFKLAVNAFEESLKLRPFFKEALDGLDLAKGRGYIYTINDTTARYTYGLPTSSAEYIIDKLYRKIKNSPADDQSRFQLIDELVKVQRFEEAYEQLKYLQETYPNSDDFKNLYSRVLEYRNAYYKNKIDEYRILLSKNPDNTDALIQLGRYYSYQKEYELAKEMYIRYLKLEQDDFIARYSFAQLLTWKNELDSAKNETDVLLTHYPDNKGYQMLGANIRLWMDKDLDESLLLYNKVLTKEPENITALLGLANVYLKLKNVVDAEAIYSRLQKNKNVNKKELNELSINIELAKERILTEKLYSYLEKARKYSFNNQCSEAINYFEKYFDEGGTNKQIYFELANAYQCDGNYEKAISLYSDLVADGFDDYETLKLRAKVIFWSGDSLNALREFRNLVENNPNDAETKLFLADTYLQLKQYRSARELYSELLDESPNSHILKTRMKWLGSEGITGFSFNTFPTYVLVSPQGNYFSDNTGFNYKLGGLGVESGVTNSLSIGVSGYRGSLSSGFSNINFNNLKGSVFIRMKDNISLMGSFGQSYFSNDLEENIIEASINLTDKKTYSANVFYNNMDAAFVLYSPFLVTNRLTSEYIGFNGNYSFKSGLFISGKYALINVSDANQGNQFQFRIGKDFQDDIKAGYEYYYYNILETTELYWSPQNFESHSVWADFTFVKDIETNLNIGGKLGLIPENDFLLREFFAEVKYKLAANFNLQAKFVTGSSSRSGIGYNSTSFQFSAFWTL